MSISATCKQSRSKRSIESCVNRVGVDLNTASWALLRYVAGITERTAQKIVEYPQRARPLPLAHAAHGGPGLGPKTFEQAAGFLRIRGGDNPLDMTAVHPESYPVVEQIAQSLGVTDRQTSSRKPELLEKVKIEGFVRPGLYTLNDILRRAPQARPRSARQIRRARIREDVREIADLKPGMVLEGVVTNVTQVRRVRRYRRAPGRPGAHQRAVQPLRQGPDEVVKAGQIVKVQVLSADAKAKRIALSMKALEARPPSPSGRTSRSRRSPKSPRWKTNWPNSKINSRPARDASRRVYRGGAERTCRPGHRSSATRVSGLRP